MRFVLTSIVLSLLVVYVVEAYPYQDGTISQYWVDQPRNHSDYAAGIFQQRYWVRDTFFRTGGPAFLFIGGESPDYEAALSLAFCSEYAKNLGAKCFTLEHRYYGESSPEDLTYVDPLPNGYVPPGTFKYLSSDQALEDIAAFIKYAKKAFDLQDNEWVVFGGSYSGTLAAWARQKFPDLIYAAVASSAPLEARIDFSYFRRQHITRSSGLKLHGDQGTKGKAWWYQTCTEFGWYNQASLFPSPDIEQVVGRMCNKFQEGITAETLQRAVDNTNLKHKGKKYFMERVIFVHGSEDFWRLAGIVKSPNQDLMPVFVIPGAGHCADLALYPWTLQESSFVAEISSFQSVILNKLAEWLLA